MKIGGWKLYDDSEKFFKDPISLGYVGVFLDSREGRIYMKNDHGEIFVTQMERFVPGVKPE